MQCDICNYEKVQIKVLKGFSLLVCPRCFFGRVSVLPKSVDTHKIYSSSYFKGKEEVDHLSDSERKLFFVKKFIKSNSTILDFGCGTGNFLLAAKNEGFNINGYDVSEYAAEAAQRKTGIEIHKGFSAPHIAENSLDCITCFDVIEHLVDYRDKLKLFHKWLKPNGFIFITTPNTRSWDAILMGKAWYGFKKYPEHVVYFSPQSITRVLGSSGFLVESIRTWGFIRSLRYIVDNGIEGHHAKKTFSKALNFAGLQDMNIYIPMTDMMVVATKK